MSKPTTPESNMSGCAEQATPDALLVEYQAAQDSAHHHDNMLWSTTSIMWGASLLVIGFVLQHLEDATLRPLITALSVLGLVLAI